MSGKSQRGGRGGGRGGSSSGGRGGGSPKSPQNAAKELRLTGLVRSVVSGDTVVMMEINEKTKNVAVPTEFQLTLIGLKAPSLGKRFMKDGQPVRVDDDPFAWDSREHLRKQLIGKVVVYRVEHELEFDSGALKRKFGEIWLDGKNIRFSIVEQGWAKANIRERKPKDGKPAPPPSKEDQDIQAAEAKAKAAKIGVWSDNTRNAVRKVKDRDDPSKPEEQFAFFEKLKGKSLPAVVEHVKSGSSYRVYLPETQDELTVSLSGARSPIYKPKDPTNSEEFGLEAKLYAEHVLLNRSVSVVLDGVEKFSFFATVTLGDPTFETSNFAIDLLQRGLAHYAKWSLPKKADVPLYEKAENKARDAKLKVHSVKKPSQQVVGQGGKPQKVVDQPAPPQKSVTGTVVEIVSAGSLIVRTSKGNQATDQKFLISSIKVPQLPANKKDKKKKDEGKKSDESSEEEDAVEKKQAEEKKQASFAAEQLKKAQEVTGKKTGNQKKNAPIVDPVEQKKAEGAWALEAKEYLRKTLIGKQVQCVWDYSVKGKGKGKQEGEVRDFYSVYLGNQSVGLLLVEQGLAWVMAHAENQSRAPEWKDMALAEKAAIAKNLRLHGVLTGYLHTAPVNRLLVNDLSENENYPIKGFQKQKEKKEAKDVAAKGGKKEEGKKVKGDPQKNRSFAEELKKAGKIPAIVEYVVSAGRFKLSLPTKGYLLTLGLSAIRCDPKVKVGDAQDSNIQRSYPVVEKDGKTPIYANVGFHFARNALLQRDVQVEIEGTDVGGGFVGRLWLQVGNDLIDWSYQLLKEGHAALSGFVDRVITDNNVRTQYENAEKNAQDKKLNRWHNFDREEYEAKKKEQKEGKNKGAEDEGDDEKPASFERVIVTEIMSGSNFFYQSANPDTESALKDLESAFATGNFDNEPAYAPERREKDKEKEMVAGKFTVDGAWYRAHVLRWINKGEVPEYEVRYIDYGNTEIVTKDNIRKLPDLLAKINGGKGLAQKARLAYITAPELDDDFGRDAAALFKELVWGRTMKASIRKGGRDQDVKNVSLGDEESLHVSEELVKEGLAKVHRKGPQSKNPEKPTEYQVLKATEAEAIKAHLNMWEYGELPDSEDERYHLNQLTR